MLYEVITKVKRVAPYVSAVEKQARTVDIEATFDDPKAPGTLLVGYSADIEVVLEARENVVRVPTAALLEGGRVLVAGKEGTLVITSYSIHYTKLYDHPRLTSN